MREQAETIALGLLQCGAVRWMQTKPFVWASGWNSPIYCDNRIALSIPKFRKEVTKAIADSIRNHYPKATGIAAVATGAIAQGALVADALELPLVYVRPAPKAHGLGNQIEGLLNTNLQWVMLEDLISTGGSSLHALDAMRAAGADVLGMTAIFTYGFPQAKQAFEQHECTLNTLLDYPTLLSVAQKKGLLPEHMMPSLQRWRENPAGWTFSS